MHDGGFAASARHSDMAEIDTGAPSVAAPVTDAAPDDEQAAVPKAARQCAQRVMPLLP